MVVLYGYTHVMSYPLLGELLFMMPPTTEPVDALPCSGDCSKLHMYTQSVRKSILPVHLTNLHIHICLELQHKSMVVHEICYTSLGMLALTASKMTTLHTHVHLHAYTHTYTYAQNTMDICMLTLSFPAATCYSYHVPCHHHPHEG